MIRIKVCGLTNYSDAQAAVDAGVDMLGFIFYSKSPRAVVPDRVRRIISALDFHGKSIVKIGVFVNEQPEEICTILDQCKLDAAQLHGEEPVEYLGLSGGSLLQGRAYKAIRPESLEAAVRGVDEFMLPEHLRSERQLPAILIDSYHPDLRGGTGETGDWDVAARMAEHCPILLAGGLGPENVGGAVERARPWGVDVSSGIEEKPGKKDHAAIIEFVQAVRKASGDG